MTVIVHDERVPDPLGFNARTGRRQTVMSNKRSIRARIGARRGTLSTGDSSAPATGFVAQAPSAPNAAKPPAD